MSEKEIWPGDRVLGETRRLREINEDKSVR